MLVFLVVLSAVIAGLIKVGFGVGAGIFLTPLLSLVLAPKITVGLMAPMMLVTDINALYYHWKRWDWGQVKLLLPSTVLGTFFGSYFLAWASPSLLKTTIGIIAISFSAFQMYKIIKPERFENLRLKNWHGVIICFIAGISSAIAHSGGIIITLYLVGLGLVKEAFVATLVFILFFTSTTKMILYWNLGILTKELLLYGLALTPVMFFGGWLGKLMIKRLSDKQFVLYINILIFISGIILIIKP